MGAECSGAVGAALESPGASIATLGSPLPLREDKATALRPGSLRAAAGGSGGRIRTGDLRVMSPTSYHCSTPRRRHGPRRDGGAACAEGARQRPIVPTAKPPVSSARGRCTTVFGMGTGGPTSPESPRPVRAGSPGSVVSQLVHDRRSGRATRPSEGANEAPSALSTASLRRLPVFHARPIHPLISRGPYGLNALGDLILGWASHLDAFSAYPDPTTATEPCPWQNNSSTGGRSAPVLSY